MPGRIAYVTRRVASTLMETISFISSIGVSTRYAGIACDFPTLFTKRIMNHSSVLSTLELTQNTNVKAVHCRCEFVICNIVCLGKIYGMGGS